MAPKFKAKAKKKSASAHVPTSQPVSLEMAAASNNTPLEIEDGPVSSRTRHGGKAKMAINSWPATISANSQSQPGLLPVPVSLPPLTPSDIGLPTDFGGTYDFTEAGFPIGEDILTHPWSDLLAATNPPPVSKKPSKKKLGQKAGPLGDCQAPTHNKLSRSGDSRLEKLALPTGCTDYARNRLCNESASHYARNYDSTSPKDREQATNRNDPATEQYDVQCFVAGEANSLICKCTKPLVPNAAELMRLARSWLLQSKTLSYTAECSSCDSSTCIECGALDIPAKHKCVRAAKSQTPSAYFIVWVLLCGLDECVRPELVSSKVSIKSAKRKRKAASSNAAWASGTGYGGGGDDGWGGSTDSVNSMSDGSADEKERCINKALSELSRRLPDLLNQPHSLSLVLPMLQKSRLQLTLARYLENDSLHNVSKDTAFYTVLLKIVDTLLIHKATQSMVLDPRVIDLTQDDLLDWTYADLNGRLQLDKTADKHRKAIDRAPESRESLCTALRRSNAACEVFETNVDRNSKLASDTGTKEMLKVCKLLKVTLARAGAVTDTSLEKSNSQATQDVNLEEDWFRANCLLDVDDRSIHVPASKGYSSSYHFSSDALSITKMRPGRIKHLLTEMVMLKTSLPPGIFVRHEVSRLDIMKVLIIGPKGTPYENGAFEFDFFCLDTYPNSPPLVQFKQTGGGTESMNPNLYPDGKVCLSLLGTWQGTPWQPGKSTLLQVLLSLQGMVFCDEPYYNEPGWSAYKNDTQSKSYNRNLYRATTQVAIIHWLEAMEERQKSKSKASAATGDTIWDDVLLHHFATNASDIVATLKLWEADVVQAKKEAEEAAKAAQAAQQAAANGVSANAPNFPPPIPNQWGHYEHGKPQLTALVPRVEKALEGLVERVTAAGIIPSSSPSGTKTQRAIKGPAELSKNHLQTEEDDEIEGASKRTRSKRRKMWGKA